MQKNSLRLKTISGIDLATSRRVREFFHRKWRAMPPSQRFLRQRGAPPLGPPFKFVEFRCPERRSFLPKNPPKEGAPLMGQLFKFVKVKCPGMLISDNWRRSGTLPHFRNPRFPKFTNPRIRKMVTGSKPSQESMWPGPVA